MHNIATTRPDLTDVVKEYSDASPNEFMAERILPVFGTPNYNDTFWKLDVTQKTKTAPIDLERAPGGTYKAVDFAVESDSYTTEDKGLKAYIDDREKNQYKDAFDAESETAMLVQNFINIEKEKSAAALLFSASNFAGHTSGVGTEWSNAAGTPFADINGKIKTLKDQVGGTIGQAKMCLAVSEKVFRNILDTTEIKAKIKGGDASEQDKVFKADEAGAKRLANILNIDEVYFSNSQDNGTDIWDDEYALLFLKSDSRALKSAVQLGRTFLWEVESVELPVVETYREEDKRSDVVRVRHDSVQKIFTYRAGYLLGNITA